MIKDSKIRARLKTSLIVLNVALAATLICLLVSWLFFVRPGQFKIASSLGQYIFYYMDNLPAKVEGIDPDYIGEHKNAIISTEPEDEIKLSPTNSEDSAMPEIRTASELDEEELLNKADEILKKTNAIIGHNNKSHEQIKIKRKYKNAKIAIIVTNLGLNRRSTELALTLPKECALGFLPYTKNLKPLLHKAQSRGHEIFLYLPLENENIADNPGRYALQRNLAPEENAVRLNIVLSSHARYDGVYSNFREIFTQDKKASELVLETLDDKNLIFLLGRDPSKELPSHIQKFKNIIPINVIIDIEPDKEMIEKGLEELLIAAGNAGKAIGYAHGFTLTIEMIRNWLPLLAKQGITLVPISELQKENN